METKTEYNSLNPELLVERDYEGTFEKRVKRAIEVNKENKKEMFSKIIVTSGAYRQYCFAYHQYKEKDEVHLDFYAASRVFGFEHSIQDIADSICKENTEENGA